MFFRIAVLSSAEFRNPSMNMAIASEYPMASRQTVRLTLKPTFRETIFSTSMFCASMKTVNNKIFW